MEVVMPHRLGCAPLRNLNAAAAEQPALDPGRHELPPQVCLRCVRFERVQHLLSVALADLDWVCHCSLQAPTAECREATADWTEQVPAIMQPGISGLLQFMIAAGKVGN